jgi:5-methylcytosine-specific restriction endonuclease McrA
MRCYICEQDLPETEFYEAPEQSRGYTYDCKKCNNKRSLEYQKENWRKVKATHDEWMKNHPEHKDYQNEYNKTYRQLPNFREKNREYQKKYARTEKGRYAGILRTNRYRSRSRALINDLTYEQFLTIKESQQNKCAICHKPFTDERRFELDHIVPVVKSKPGDPGLTYGNTQLLCRTCNAEKNSKV